MCGCTCHNAERKRIGDQLAAERDMLINIPRIQLPEVDQLAYVDPRKWPTEEHLRVFEAYARDHIPNYQGYMDEPTQKRAIDWWNASCPDKQQDGFIEIKIADLSRVVLEPGDVLLVRYNRPNLDMAQAQTIRERLSAHFPGHDIVVLTDGVQLSVVRPRDNAPTTPEAGGPDV